MIIKNKAINIFLVLIMASVFVMPFVSSCGKAAQISGAGSNTQLSILNLSPDLGPMNVYANFINLNLNNGVATSYIYP
jgi:hypothetical protein